MMEIMLQMLSPPQSQNLLYLRGRNLEEYRLIKLIFLNKIKVFQKELAKELKAKDGLERFLSLASGNLLNPRAYTPDLMEYSRELYEESKAKTTFLRMQLERYFNFFCIIFWVLGHLSKMCVHCFFYFSIWGDFFFVLILLEFLD